MKRRQAAAARAVLRLTVDQLAKETGIGSSTLNRFESGMTRLQPSTEKALIRFFEDRGVAFREHANSYEIVYTKNLDREEDEDRAVRDAKAEATRQAKRLAWHARRRAAKEGSADDAA